MIFGWIRLAGTLWAVMTLSLVGGLARGYSTPADIIAFVAPVERSPQLYAVDVDTRLLLQLTDFGSSSVYNLNALSWSPDGNEITMEYWEASNAEILAYDLQRREVAFRYRGLAGDRAPLWSPDGSKILFTHLEDGAAYLYTIDAATNEANALHEIPYYFNFRAYAWSPDSRYIAYYFRRMFVFDTATGAVREIAAEYNFEDLEQLIWTPDGCCVVFTSVAPGARGRNPPRNIYQANIETGEVLPLLENPYNEFRPFWLDGKDELIYQTFDPYGQIRRLDVATGETIFLADMKPSDVSFSPDGRYLAYLKVEDVRQARSNEQLWVEDLHTGQSFPLTPSGMAPRGAVWGP